MAIKCERCGRSVQAALEVLKRGTVVEFYRCRCGSKAALMPDRAGPATEVRRARGNLFLRLRGTKIFISDGSALDSGIGSLEEEFAREAGHVVVNLEEVNYLPESSFKRLEALRSKVEEAGHHMAIVNNMSSMKALMQEDAPALAQTLAENEKKALGLVTRSE